MSGILEGGTISLYLLGARLLRRCETLLAMTLRHQLPLERSLHQRLKQILQLPLTVPLLHPQPLHLLDQGGELLLLFQCGKQNLRFLYLSDVQRGLRNCSSFSTKEGL